MAGLIGKFSMSEEERKVLGSDRGANSGAGTGRVHTLLQKTKDYFVGRNIVVNNINRNLITLTVENKTVKVHVMLFTCNEDNRNPVWNPGRKIIDSAIKERENYYLVLLRVDDADPSSTGLYCFHIQEVNQLIDNRLPHFACSPRDHNYQIGEKSIDIDRLLLFDERKPEDFAQLLTREITQFNNRGV